MLKAIERARKGIFSAIMNLQICCEERLFFLVSFKTIQRPIIEEEKYKRQRNKHWFGKKPKCKKQHCQKIAKQARFFNVADVG